MFAFTLTVFLAFGQASAVKGVTVQSQAVYLSMEDCGAAMEEMGKVILAGLPPGARAKVGGSCYAPEGVEG